MFGAAGIGFVLIVAMAGCRGEEVSLKTAYGRRRGSAAASVNGTSALAELFRRAGGRPVTVLGLSAGLEKYDVIVWAPDSFEMPREKVREFLEDWLKSRPGRTLVYIGRDYDASCEYWQAMVARAPPEQRREVMRREAEARAAHSHARLAMPSQKRCEWFVMRRDFPGHYVDALSGPWSVGCSASESRIWNQGRLDIPESEEDNGVVEPSALPRNHQTSYTPLLTSAEAPLAFEVARPSWATSRIVVVANGSFLLNLPLVNHQHRRLAGKLIDHCRPFERVAFLESQRGGPLIFGEIKPVDEDALRLRVLLAGHWLLLGVVFCFYMFPIFGRPRSIETETAADFGQHVDAVAALLERTGDRRYAQRQLELYRKGQRVEAEPETVVGGPATADSKHPGDKHAP